MNKLKEVTLARGTGIDNGVRNSPLNRLESAEERGATTPGDISIKPNPAEAAEEQFGDPRFADDGPCDEYKAPHPAHGDHMEADRPPSAYTGATGVGDASLDSDPSDRSSMMNPPLYPNL